MRKLLTILICCQFLYSCHISPYAVHYSYYISANGDNTTGRTPAQAWTIAKLSSSMSTIVAGDSVLFNRGETFYGKKQLVNSGTAASPICFGAYGKGAKPIITGLTAVTGWVNLGGNIWEAPTSGVRADVNLVLRDGAIKQVGRYPNNAYLTYTASTATSITGPALSTTTNWTGAEVAIRLFRWEIRRRKVTGHLGGVVSFETMTDVPRPNYGYFFQRDARTLDADGEWFQSANKIRMYFSNNNPNIYKVQVATKDTLIKSSKSYLVFDNLSFYGCNKAALMQNGGSNITIKNCTVNKTGEDGIATWFATNVTVDNCSVDSSLGAGIRIRGTTTAIVNLTVKNCLVNHTALLPGMEANGNHISSALTVYGGDNITAINNTVKNSGYNGIDWHGNNVLIKNNFIDSFCSVRDDGGAIYTYTVAGTTIIEGSNRRIVSNIIDHGIGQSQGTDAAYLCANGIYTDEGTRDVYMDSNTISRVPYNAFQGNNNSNLTIRYNTVFNCYVGFAFQRLNNGPIMRGFKVAKNIFYPYRYRYRNLAINLPTVLTKEQDIPLMYEILDSNYYTAREGIDTSLWSTVQWSDKTHTAMTANNFNYLVSVISVETRSLNLDNTASIYYNATGAQSLALFSGLSKKDVFGKVYDNSAIIGPWESKILLPNGNAHTANSSPVAIAGVDQVIALPVNTTTLKACSSSDADGKISSYLWKKISGPAGEALATPKECECQVSGLVSGVYKYEMLVTDNLGSVGKDTVQVTVNPAPANKLPNVTAGGDHTITLPVDSVTINSGATDADGTITSYAWAQVAGPAIATIVNKNSATTNIKNLVQGVYNFEVTATDNNAAKAKDSALVTVNPPVANSSPFANAGSDQEITLPANSITLDGSLSMDPDGTVVSYVWTEGTATVGSGKIITINGLTAGFHTYTLTVTDNRGGKGTDEVNVMVFKTQSEEVLLGW